MTFLNNVIYTVNFAFLKSTAIFLEVYQSIGNLSTIDYKVALSGLNDGLHSTVNPIETLLRTIMIQVMQVILLLRNRL